MADEASNISPRLDALETLCAHQDRTLAELNEMVTAQWRKIDALERQVARLRDELQNIGSFRDAPEPPPPHY